MILTESWHDDAVLYNRLNGQSLSWESKRSTPSQEIPSNFCEPHNYLRFHNSSPLFPILSWKNLIHDFPNDFLKIHIVMFPIYAPVFQVVFSPHVSSPILSMLLSYPPIPATCPFHYIPLYQSGHS